jgi:hypothetical protein
MKKFIFVYNLILMLCSQMENYVFLPSVHDRYREYYQHDWQILFSVYHWVMLKKQLLAVDANKVRHVPFYCIYLIDLFS